MHRNYLRLLGHGASSNWIRNCKYSLISSSTTRCTSLYFMYDPITSSRNDFKTYHRSSSSSYKSSHLKLSIFPNVNSEEMEQQPTNDTTVCSISQQELGRLFEQHVIQFLSQEPYDFQLSQTLSSHDQGIDFKGFWNLPFKCKLTSQPISVLGQCKREKDTTGVKSIREFEGVLSHYHLRGVGQHVNTTTQTNCDKNEGTPSNTIIGLFVSYSGFTEFAVRQAIDSKYPIILIRLSLENESASTASKKSDQRSNTSTTTTTAISLPLDISDEYMLTYFCMNHAAQNLIPGLSTSVVRRSDGKKYITFQTL
ncbi:hypothetical protein C9374_002463 [Naegleria lovaniensis]|uniref:Restriction endonuclease type IV Mrr domain-containing protein n=1 Tax=Naegleria lovaniensis TaxID=51637 RepID=A0AA88GVY8_NAELO|nr:uncharacterized protein C9374_002463 [Naegleria lovaniensis]KAG2386719.1 hypothetical protein C9374_002463 [Naegleria lovaniensis]